MGFIRENILKIVVFIIILVIMIIVFVFAFGGKKISIMTTDSYPNMEKSMVSAANKYVNNNKKLLPNSENEVSKINLDTLENEKYIKVLTSPEDNNIKCTGYVEISYKDGNYSYVPYLKCGNKYETKTMASYIRDNETIVTSGEGLYKIGETLVYRGENPNNYLLLGTRLYRIIDINEQELRLISVDRIRVSFLWDNRYNIEKNRFIGINDFTKSRLSEYLDEIYNESSTNTKNPIFSTSELNKIIPHDICIGKRDLNNGTIDSYNECQVTAKDRMISLITVSDVARASIDSNCKSIYDKSCVNYNYFSNISTSIRTITAVSNNTYQVYDISNGVANTVNASNSFRINVVAYIGASSIYYKGNGTKENPYIVR